MKRLTRHFREINSKGGNSTRRVATRFLKFLTQIETGASPNENGLTFLSLTSTIVSFGRL